MNTLHPVVLLHASAGSGRQWAALAEQLRERGHQVHTPDFYGHGSHVAWSQRTPMSLANEAAPIERALESLGGAHVVGHSYGGAVALKLASRRPALVKSLTVYEPVLFGLLLDDPFSRREAQTVVAVADSMRRHLAQGRSDLAGQRFIDFWAGTSVWAGLSAERQRGFAALVPPVLQQFDALFGDPLTRADLARLPMPLLLAGGEATVPVARRLMQLLRAALPAVQHAAFDTLGHMGPVTHADLFNRRVGEFLQGLAAQRQNDRIPALFTS